MAAKVAYSGLSLNLTPNPLSVYREGEKNRLEAPLRLRGGVGVGLNEKQAKVLIL